MFEPNKIYKRSAIHDQYGGNRQSGICPSRSHPFIFIFSGKSGQAHGYRDGWDNHKVFSYTGEGQKGDMEFTRGNLALLEHVQAGKRVFLFEAAEKTFVKFVTELELFDWDLFETPDTEGINRQAIRFFFKRFGYMLDIEKDQLNMVAEPDLEYHVNIPNYTERRGLVTSRVGQGAYRKSILHRWEYQCAVTQFNHTPVLIASHILPWREANDTQRLDVDNGILLSPTYDALFDRNLISFDEKGKIMIGSELQAINPEKVGVTGRESVTTFTSKNQDYLEQHRLLLK